MAFDLPSSPGTHCRDIVVHSHEIDDICWEHMDIPRYLFFNTTFFLLHDSVLHPLELLKARQQHYSGSKTPLGAWATARSIIQREGARRLSVVGIFGIHKISQGLFRGLVPSTLGNIPGQLIYFGVYEYLKQSIINLESQSQIASKAAIGFAAGFVADVASLLAHTPAEVVSVRLMVSTAQMDYGAPATISATAVPTARKVLTDVWRMNGVPGLYRGLGGSILAHGPASAAWFCTYEFAKQFLHQDPYQSPSIPVYMLAGATAGAASVIVSNPLDVAKVRIQTSLKPIGFFHVLFGVVRTEGLAGMMKGIGPRMCMAVPGSALTFACYEIVKKLSLRNRV